MSDNSRSDSQSQLNSESEKDDEPLRERPTLPEQTPEQKAHYFGCPIQPFSTREDRLVGRINKDQFFEFSRAKKDPWLEQLEQQEYKLLTRKQQKMASKTAVKKQKKSKDEFELLDRADLVELISDLLPEDLTPAQFMKKLNPPKGKSCEEFDKILQLCSAFIKKTGDYEVMTRKRSWFQSQVKTQ